MIDVHCHLEREDFAGDRDEVIESCRKELKAVVTTCAHPKNFELTMELVEKHKGFVFACCGIHPLYIKEISENEKDRFLDGIKQNKHKIVAIGECGLDFFWIKEGEWHEKQKELFRELIRFAKELRKPVVVHSRDATEECMNILEEENAKDVLMHLFGEKNLVERVKKNNWLVSMGPIIARSKTHKRIARDMPLENILLETDSPWFGDNGKRGTPLNIKIPAQKIAEVKKLTFEEVWKKAGENAEKFFKMA